ncbi:MAG TPA: vitamin K epoxide reductase family protein [Longimicrobiales bacterium]
MLEDSAEQDGPPSNRMAIAVLALLGVLISAYLTLHKYGYIGTLACGSGECETVQTSKYAIFAGVPVPVLGLAGYLLLLAVAIAGLQAAWIRSRAFALGLFMLADGALLFSLYLTYLEKFVIHAWCRWCIASAVVTLLIWLFALAELPRLRRSL